MPLLDWHSLVVNLFHFGASDLAISVLEKIVRPIAVYLLLVFALRRFGKRILAQLNPFDLVVLLTLSNTVQNAIIGNDTSLLAAWSGGGAARHQRRAGPSLLSRSEGGAPDDRGERHLPDSSLPASGT